MPDTSLRAGADILASTLPPNQAAFLRRVYSKGLENYRLRLSAAGMTGLNRILDAGCGFGQWSLSMTAENTEVHAMDTSRTRLEVLKKLAAQTGIDGITCHEQTLPATDFPDGHFDGVFCYGVIFLTPWRESIRELHRILAPGGRLYVNANGFGWCRHLWHTAHNETADYDPRHYAAQTLMRTWRYNNGQGHDGEGDILIEPNDLQDALDAAGFTHIQQGPEGSIVHPGHKGPAPSSFFCGEYGGDTGVHEAIAVKAKG